jgi:membrane protease YdiL (CAAX protease family)
VMRVAFFVASAYVGATLFNGVAAFIFHPGLLAVALATFATGLTANLVTMRIFDRRPLADIGLAAGQGSGRNFLLGFVLSALAGALLLTAPLLAGSGHLVTRENGSFSWFSVLFYLILLIFGAAGEEAIFHGYAFQLLVEKMGPFATVLPVAVLFGLAHGSNPNASRLGLANTALWGILLGFAFLRSRDLWLPIGLHYGWNAVLPLFGSNLSGITIEITRYTYRWDLAPLWSGGDYGPEGGLLATIFIAMLFFALAKAPIAPQVAAIAKSLNEPAWEP